MNNNAKIVFDNGGHYLNKNQKYMIGPFDESEESQELMCDVIELIETSPFGGFGLYVYDNEYIVIEKHNMCYELEYEIRELLGQEEEY